MQFDRWPVSPGDLVCLVLLLSAPFLLVGCFDSREVALPPEEEPQNRSDVGLGSGVRSLSAGLGEKGSPSWSPSGDRIAFTMDGYVVEKAPESRDFERRTTKDFEAQTLTWSRSEEDLTILGANSRSGETGATDAAPDPARPLGVYKSARGEGSLQVSRVTDGVQEMVPGPPDSGWVLLALEAGDSGSRLALLESGEEVRPFAGEVEGEVTGISISPGGEQAILAIRDAASNRFDIYTFSLQRNSFRRVARLEEGLEVFGDPQWTSQGIYYVAGEQQEAAEPDAAPFDLYRIPENTSSPERAPGVGDDFVASSLKRAPEGERLAVIGRRNPASADNLYVLDLGSGNLEAATSNEDMQIKTGPEDLTWSDAGDSVVIVARAVLSEPQVYSASADTLVTDFYNLYEVPVSTLETGG